MPEKLENLNYEIAEARGFELKKNTEIAIKIDSSTINFDSD